METKNGFTKLSPKEFELWLSNIRLGRTILKIQQHHTFIPSYVHFNGSNHFERQLAMKQYHTVQNGWQDIGQHFTIFPDGSIVTGRSLEKSPACITNQNVHSICIENFGNFDINGDEMTVEQRESILTVTAALCKRFNLQVDSNSIVYHHWFRLDNGLRTNGGVNTKSCPGTAFFGGNKVVDFDKNFKPLVIERLKGDVKTNLNAVLYFVCVTSSTLNIRSLPTANSSKVTDRPSLVMGAILRIYEEKDGWYKISSSQSHWISSKFTKQVKRAEVNADTLNVRTGPDVKFSKSYSIQKGEIVFLFEEKNGWCRIGMEEKWVSAKFLNF
ncbi:SH3 domain-containing protein [Flavobacterium terrigena]|uniref:SH3 domain-containing protein n=1 Tax=Flavobacterium terrigena TaxID=402734 RepID=A0A1H6SF26_9FLAO|nr:SH3 domain-containing protein [Flavobacterium terrigena]SEI63387.1 SH3 domain-containing protein [Flavobacterium terrigena]